MIIKDKSMSPYIIEQEDAKNFILKKYIKELVDENGKEIPERYVFIGYYRTLKGALKEVASMRSSNDKRVLTIHSGLKNWVRIFKGVSTKHLDNYLNFYKIMKTVKGDIFEECISINNYMSNKNINEKKLSF